jgi:hypothetical protein
MRMGLGLNAGGSAKALWPPLDPTAATYIAAVEAADGQSMNTTIKIAVNDFFVGLKADASPNSGVSNYQALTQFFLFFAAKTLAGSLVPCKGNVPINTGLVSGDFTVKQGLTSSVGKFLGSTYNGNFFAQDNNSGFGWMTALPTDTNGFVLTDGLNVTGAYMLLPRGTPSNDVAVRSQSNTADIVTPLTLGFVGTSRNSSTQFNIRTNGTTSTITRTSQTPRAVERLYLNAPGAAGAFTGKLGAAGQGAAITMSALDSRLTTLAAAVAAS